MVDLNINLVAKMAGAGAGGAAGGVAGAAGAGLAGRAGGVMAAGLMGGAGGRTEMIGKGLGQISKQLPGAGMLGDMAGAFKSGGVVGVGMAGVAGIMGFVKQIMESSKVFQGIAGSFFKIFGAMADVFLLPFLPLAMRGMTMLMKYLPNFSKWGESAAQGVDNIIKTFKDKGWIGGIVHYIKEAWSFISVDVVGWITTTLKPAIAAAVLGMGKTLMNAVKGKETKYMAPITAPGGGGGITRQVGKWDFSDKEYYTDPLTNVGKSIFNLAARGMSPGGKGPHLEWNKPKYVFSGTGEPLNDEQQLFVEQLEKSQLDPEAIQRIISEGQGPFGKNKEGGSEFIGPMPAKQLGGTIRSYQPGGEVPGSPGQGIHVMLHGGEGIIPAGNMALAKATKGDALDILIGAEGGLQTIAAAVTELKLRGRKDRLNPRSAANRLKNEGVKDTLPQTLENVDIFYHELGDMTVRIQNNTWGIGRGILGGTSTFAADGGKQPSKPPPTYKEALKETQAILKGTSWETAAPPNSLDLDMGFDVVTWTVEASPAFTRKKTPPTYEEAYNATKKILADTSWAGSAPSNSTDLDMGFNEVTGKVAASPAFSRDRDPYNVAATTYANVGSDVVGGDRTAAQKAQDRTNSLAAIERRKQREIEAERLADSLTAARAAIYGPEGGINPVTGSFEHGGLLARTSDSEAMRIKTFDEVNLTDQQREDLAAEGKYDFLNVGTTTIKAPAPKAEAILDEDKLSDTYGQYVRPSGEIMELAKRMAAQLNYIASFQPLIAAAWRLSEQGLEGGRNQNLRGTEAQRLIRKRSQAEEAHTRMMNQGAQDRLPYSLQEFQTRFPNEFPESDKGYGAGGFAAGGIVPGDIGDPQLIMAHGGEQISPVGMSGGRRGHTSNRVMNISINNASSVRDILRDLNDMESMDDASFFNSVT
jgi:hypothetical protein